MRTVHSFALAGLLLFCGARIAGAQDQPAFAQSFEAVGSADMPGTWTLPGDGYGALLTQQGAFEGSNSFRVHSVGPKEVDDFGTFALDRLDATPFRAQQVRLRAWVRADSLGPQSGAGLWLRVDGSHGQIAFLDNMRNRKITATNWQPYEIVAEVPEDAVTIRFGLILYGSGQAWIDEVYLDVISPAATPSAEPPRPLTTGGLANLTAFARLLGYVRYFYPGEAAAATNWDSVAVAGVRAVEVASDAEELAQLLTGVFEPLIPNLQVVPNPGLDEAPPPSAETLTGRQTVRWVHRGVFNSSHDVFNEVIRGTYRSERLSYPADNRVGAGALDPAWPPYRARIAPDIVAWVPIILRTDSVNELTQENLLAQGQAMEVARRQYSGADRATRLANVVLAWNVFEHFYPYFEVVEVNWDSALEEALVRAATDSNECDHLYTLRRLVAGLDDGHGAVSHLCDSGSRVPPLALGWVDNHPTVVRTGVDAEEIHPGDRILRIDGRSALDVLHERFEHISAATPQSKYDRGLRDLLAGSLGSEVELHLERVSGETATVRINRTAVAGAPVGVRRDSISQIEPGIWYLDLTRIAPQDWTANLVALQQAEGIVFDLRGYPSLPNFEFLQHLIREPIASMQWHVPLVVEPDRHPLLFERRPSWELRPRAPYLPARRVFITNGLAISAAETLLSLVESNGLAEIVGEATAGTNGTINPFHLPGGYTVRWTGMKVLKSDGSRHHGVGILPTIPVARTRAAVAAGRDEYLEAAIEVLRPR